MVKMDICAERGNTVFFIRRSGIDTLMLDQGVTKGLLLAFKISGELRLTADAVEGVARSGDVVWARAESELRISDSGKTAFIFAQGELVEALCEYYSLISIGIVNAPECADGFFKICSATSGDDTAYILHGILGALKKARLGTEKSVTDVIALIKEYLDANVRSRMTLDMLSETFFLSRSQIFRQFKARYGVAPMQYLISKKVDAAKEMLTDGTMRIVDIAEALSFADAKHLSKIFKKYTGVLPRSYRKEIKASVSAENAGMEIL